MLSVSQQSQPLLFQQCFHLQTVDFSFVFLLLTGQLLLQRLHVGHQLLLLLLILLQTSQPRRLEEERGGRRGGERTREERRREEESRELNFSGSTH